MEAFGFSCVRKWVRSKDDETVPVLYWVVVLGILPWKAHLVTVTQMWGRASTCRSYKQDLWMVDGASICQPAQNGLKFDQAITKTKGWITCLKYLAFVSIVLCDIYLLISVTFCWRLEVLRIQRCYSADLLGPLSFPMLALAGATCMRVATTWS